MEKKNNIPTQAPLLGINMTIIKRYLLAPDEMIFFNWLVSAEAYKYGFVPFFHSSKNICKELNLNKARVETIVKSFSARGFIQTENRIMRQGGKCRFFFVDFSCIAKKLSEIMDKDEDNEAFKDCEGYFKTLARVQKEAMKGEAVPKYKATKKRNNVDNNIDSHDVDLTYNMLCASFADRCKMFNDTQDELKAKGKDYQGKKTPIQLPRNNAVNTGLQKLSERYDQNTIDKVFLAFADTLIKREHNIKNPLAYFCKYDAEHDSFPNFESYLSYFQRNYSYGAPE